MTRYHLESAIKNAGLKYTIENIYDCDGLIIGYYYVINNLSGRDSLSYTWFRSLINHKNIFVFDHRYSMRTGKSLSGSYERFSAYNRIAILNNLSFEDIVSI